MYNQYVLRQKSQLVTCSQIRSGYKQPNSLNQGSVTRSRTAGGKDKARIPGGCSSPVKGPTKTREPGVAQGDGAWPAQAVAQRHEREKEHGGRTGEVKEGGGVLFRSRWIRRKARRPSGLGNPFSFTKKKCLSLWGKMFHAFGNPIF